MKTELGDYNYSHSFFKSNDDSDLKIYPIYQLFLTVISGWIFLLYFKMQEFFLGVKLWDNNKHKGPNRRAGPKQSSLIEY